MLREFLFLLQKHNNNNRKGSSKNALKVRSWRQRRAQILMYSFVHCGCVCGVFLILHCNDYFLSRSQFGYFDFLNGNWNEHSVRRAASLYLGRSSEDR